MLHVRITEPLFAAVTGYLLPPEDRRERICFTFGQRVEAGEDSFLLFADSPLLLDEDCYTVRGMDGARLPKDIMDGVLLRFAASGAGVLANWHSHGFSQGGTAFSGTDDRDDRRLARWLAGPFAAMLQAQPHIGPARPLSSLALVVDHGGLAARLVQPDGGFTPVDRVEIVGPRRRVVRPYNAPSRPAAAAVAALQRQKDFIPPPAQADLAEMNIGIVGVGGVGCIAGEAVARLGAGRVVLVDGDKLEQSNLNRWLGAGPGEVGQFKAQILAERLSRQVPACRVTPVCQPLQEAFGQLRGCDLIVGAVDNDFARLQLNRLASQYLIPWFDTGTAIHAGEGGLDFRHRLLGVYPGTSACLECTGFEVVSQDSQDGILAELADDALRAGRHAAGYVMDRPEIQAPSVLGLNLMAVGELMAELINYLVAARPAATQVYARWADNFRQRADRAGVPEIPSAVCPSCALRLGAGDSQPLPVSGRGRRQVAEELAAWRRIRRGKLASAPNPAPEGAF